MIIEKIIKKTISKINEQLPLKKKFLYKRDTQIFGPKSKLDSLIIVNLFIDIESLIKKKMKKKITLLNDSFFDGSANKKFTFGDLLKLIDKKLKSN
tara:strand:- start:176 stop:463 length:288 start_codon:yes stop_codon:yes gene_type:complete